jgi:ABC-2 type transport system permease protein
MRFIRFSKGFFLAEIREFEVVFWSVVFPLLLYLFLSAVLGGEGKPQGAAFNLAVVRNGTSQMAAMALDKTLEAVGGEDGPFRVTDFTSVEDALDAMKRGKQDVVAVTGGAMIPASMSYPIALHSISGKESSQVAANILDLAFEKANLEVARFSDPGFKGIRMEEEAVAVSASGRSVAYKDYLFPSVALIMMLSVALLNSPLSLSFYRSSGTNRKIFTTPLRPLEFFASHLVKLLATMLISLALLYLMAWFGYGVRGGIFSLRFFLSLVLGMVTLISMGLMIAVVASKESAVMVIGQISYQVMMFMGGFFFPVMGLPLSIRWLVYVVPTTYLVELLRRGMGIRTMEMASIWLIAVPLAWLALSVSVFAGNFRKVMGNE